MPLEILHLLGTAQSEGTGIARIVGTLASGLDPDRYRVHAWFLGPPGPLVDELGKAGATARQMGWWRGAGDPVGAFRFWRSIREGDFAIVHQHFGARSVRGIVRRASNAQIVVHLHGCQTQRVDGADLVIAASRAIALGASELKPVVIHAGVELPPERTDERASGGEVVIGAACRLVREKGLIDLLHAVALLRPEFPGIRLEIAGTGPQSADLEKEAVALGITNWLHFFGWQPGIGTVFRRWDIFAMPSHEEGFGMAALEAMADGLPVVATSVGGLPEIVEQGQTGYLVPPRDVNELARNLRILITDPELRRQMGTHGRKRAQDHFSASRMVNEFAAVYASLIAEAHTATIR